MHASLPLKRPHPLSRPTLPGGQVGMGVDPTLDAGASFTQSDGSLAHPVILRHTFLLVANFKLGYRGRHTERPAFSSSRSDTWLGS